MTKEIFQIVSNSMKNWKLHKSRRRYSVAAKSIVYVESLLSLIWSRERERKRRKKWSEKEKTIERDLLERKKKPPVPHIHIHTHWQWANMDQKTKWRKNRTWKWWWRSFNNWAKIVGNKSNGSCDNCYELWMEELGFVRTNERTNAGTHYYANSLYPPISQPKDRPISAIIIVRVCCALLLGRFSSRYFLRTCAYCILRKTTNATRETERIKKISNNWFLISNK